MRGRLGLVDTAVLAALVVFVMVGFGMTRDGWSDRFGGLLGADLAVLVVDKDAVRAALERR